MPRAGLTPPIVVARGADLADEIGFDQLTLAALASRLGVAVPSLYKHVGGLDALRRGIAILALGELREAMAGALADTADVPGGSAQVRALADAYRAYATAHPGRYVATLRAAPPGDAEHGAASDAILRIVFGVLAERGLAGEDAVDATRALRAALHGFVALEAAGGFGMPQDVGRSFARLVDGLDRGFGRLAGNAGAPRVGPAGPVSELRLASTVHDDPGALGVHRDSRGLPVLELWDKGAPRGAARVRASRPDVGPRPTRGGEAVRPEGAVQPGPADVGQPGPTAAPAHPSDALLQRLATSADPGVAFAALTLGLGRTTEAPEVRAVREAIPGSARARALLCGRAADGTIPLHPYAKWQGPHWTLVQLGLLGYPPGDDGLLPLGEQVLGWLLGRRHGRPPGTVVFANQPDRVRRCASQEGNAAWALLRLGLEDERTTLLVERLIGWQWPDGGWNCDKRRDARSSSFQETAIPLRALWLYGTRHGHADALHSAERAATLLLERRLLWRRSDGALIRPDWGGPTDIIHFPIQFYDVLFALQVMAESGHLGDPRCADALAMLEAKRLPDGGFPREDRSATRRSQVASRGTWADWGPAGARTSNPFVSAAALGVLRIAALATAGALDAAG